MTLAAELLIILALTLLNGLFAMSEMAVIASKKSRLKKRMDDGDKGAKIALNLAESGNDFLASIQVGITLIGVFAGAFSGATLSNKIAVVISNTSPNLAPYSAAIGLAAVVSLVTFLSLILGELVPKRIALNNPEAIASRVSRFVSFTGVFLRPVVYILSATTNFILKIIGATLLKKEAITEEEVKLLIEEGTSAGVFDKQEERMIKRVLKLDDYQAGDLMTPRTRVNFVDINEHIDDIFNMLISSNHSHFPVFDKDRDNPIGLLSIKAVFTKLVNKEVIDLKGCLKTPLFISETKRVDEVLESFKEASQHIAFVVDEYGGFAGIITLADITESIIRDVDISDESAERRIVKRTDGSLLVEGFIHVQELFDYLNINIDDADEYQTVGGLMMAKLGKIPVEGDSICLAGFKLEVVDMDRHRVDKVLVTELPSLVLSLSESGI